MPKDKKWYKKWYILVPFFIITVPTAAFIGAVIYYTIYPDCGRPLVYTLGSVDEQFGLSKEKILGELEEAEDVWEKFKKSNLFEYNENSKNPDITIDFVFDHRQKEVIATKSINDSIDNYNKEVDAYEDGVTKHEQRFILYEKKANQYEVDLEKYNEDVVQWDEGDRMNDLEFKRLNNEKTRLDSILEYLKKESTWIDDSARNLDLVRENLVEMKKEYMKTDSEQDTTVANEDNLSENGIWNPDEDKIIIYRYLGDRELKWLLAHELGHSLGLEHVGYPRSVMYYISSNAPILSLSNDDVRELSRVCVDF